MSAHFQVSILILTSNTVNMFICYVNFIEYLADFFFLNEIFLKQIDTNNVTLIFFYFFKRKIFYS